MDPSSPAEAVREWGSTCLSIFHPESGSGYFEIWSLLPTALQVRSLLDVLIGLVFQCVREVQALLYHKFIFKNILITVFQYT